MQLKFILDEMNVKVIIKPFVVVDFIIIIISFTFVNIITFNAKVKLVRFHFE